jgi:DNA-binding Lrp family transcriptional regulator
MDLKLRQRRLLKLLSINCRFSNKDIAKSLHCSEDLVEYQIKNLITQRKLASFSVQFDYSLLGYTHYHLLIKIKNFNFDKESLRGIIEVISINSSYGKYDLQLILLVKNKDELESVICKIRKIIDIQDLAIAEFYSYIKRFTNILPPISVSVKIPKNQKNKLYILNTAEYSFSDNRTPVKLDNVDKRIISLLLKNPRIKFSELSEKTGINQETIRYRVNGYASRKLIMNFGLLHNFHKYGLYTTQLLLNLKKVSQELKNFLYKNPDVFYSAQLIGSYSAIIYLVSTNPVELGQKLKEIRMILGEDLINMDLIHLEEVEKYVQFPMCELD